MPHAMENGIDAHPAVNGDDEVSIEDQFFEQISEPASDQHSMARITATTHIPDDMLPVIHMEGFTSEERLHLEQVLSRLTEINEAEIIRQQELKNELDSMVISKEDQEVDKENACHCCGEPFSFLFNRKKQCEQCSLLVCGKCINVFRKGVTQICRLCYVEDIHEGQTGKWFMVTLQKTGRNASFGCDILRASLRRQKEEEEQARLEEELARERAAAEAAAAAELEAAAAVAAAAAAAAETSSRSSHKGDRLSVASAVTGGSSGSKEKKWKFGKKNRKSDVVDAGDTHSLSLAGSQYIEDALQARRSVHEERGIDVEQHVSGDTTPSGRVSLTADGEFSEASTVASRTRTLASAPVPPGQPAPADSVPPSQADHSMSECATIPTITIESNPYDEKWTDRQYTDDENHIFPEDEDDEESPGLRTPRSAVSHESITSIYSDTSASYKLAVDVTGEVLVGMEYDHKLNVFLVKIKQCRDIAAVDNKRHKSDPYVKTYLLPDKTKVSKRKTSYRKGTLNPEFDEQVKYVISKSELETRVLSVAVWHRVALGHNIFLGEARITLDENEFDDAAPKWYPLHEKKDIAIPMPMMMYKGDLVFAIKFVPSDAPGPDALGEVQVWVKQARNLIAATSNGYSDTFCKGYLLPDRSNNGKKKTRVIRRNLNPAWNTVLRFTQVTESSLSDRCLELTVWDYGRFRPNEFLGGLRLSLGLGVHKGQHVRWMDARGHEVTMWQAMMARPRAWIEGTLMLRPNMD